MAAPYFLTNCAIAIETAIATAVAVDAITKASPGVASCTSDPSLSDGDFYALTSVKGMTEVNGRVFRANNVGGTYDFDLDLENTTDYGTFASGNVQKLTFGTNLSRTTDITSSGGDAVYEDWRELESNVLFSQATGLNPIELSLQCVWDPEDTALAQLLSDTRLLTKRAIKLTWPGGYPLMVFRGSVNCSLIPTGTIGGLTKTAISIKGDGFPTYYTAAAA